MGTSRDAEFEGLRILPPTTNTAIDRPDSLTAEEDGGAAAPAHTAPEGPAQWGARHHIRCVCAQRFDGASCQPHDEGL